MQRQLMRLVRNAAAYKLSKILDRDLALPIGFSEYAPIDFDESDD